MKETLLSEIRVIFLSLESESSQVFSSQFNPGKCPSFLFSFLLSPFPSLTVNPSYETKASNPHVPHWNSYIQQGLKHLGFAKEILLVLT